MSSRAAAAQEGHYSPQTERHNFSIRDGRMVVLRRAAPADAHDLLSALNEVAAEGRFLLRRQWPLTPELEERWASVASGGVDLLLVAVEIESIASGREVAIAGSLSLVRGRHEFIRHTAEMGMWLRLAYREAGLGSVMVESGLRWAEDNGVEKITLSLRSSNRRANNLYQKYGFVEEGRRRDFIKTPDGYEDEVLLSRSLRDPFPLDAEQYDQPGDHTTFDLDTGQEQPDL